MRKYLAKNVYGTSVGARRLLIFRRWKSQPSDRQKSETTWPLHVFHMCDRSMPDRKYFPRMEADAMHHDWKFVQATNMRDTSNKVTAVHKTSTSRTEYTIDYLIDSKTATGTECVQCGCNQSGRCTYSFSDLDWNITNESMFGESMFGDRPMDSNAATAVCYEFFTQLFGIFFRRTICWLNQRVFGSQQVDEKSLDTPNAEKATKMRHAKSMRASIHELVAGQYSKLYVQEIHSLPAKRSVCYYFYWVDVFHFGALNRHNTIKRQQTWRLNNEIHRRAQKKIIIITKLRAEIVERKKPAENKQIDRQKDKLTQK